MHLFYDHDDVVVANAVFCLEFCAFVPMIAFLSSRKIIVMVNSWLHRVFCGYFVLTTDMVSELSYRTLLCSGWRVDFEHPTTVVAIIIDKHASHVLCECLELLLKEIYATSRSREQPVERAQYRFDPCW